METVEIPLSRGLVALVDEPDAERVLKYKWTAMEAYPGLWYAYRKVNKESILLHRFIMSAEKGTLIDHKNGNGLDCRRENMRFATSSQNGANRGLQSNNTHGFKGVAFHKPTGTWNGRIKVNGKVHSLRYFKTKEEAAMAYDEAAKIYFGEFAVLNFPD